MPKYQLHIDPLPPDPNRIRERQNFNALYRDYKSWQRLAFWRNLPRNPRAFALLAAVILLVFLLVQPQTPTSFSSKAPVLSAPFSPEKSWILQADRDTLLSLHEQLSLWIPANSLLDSAKKPVTGQVELRFRSLGEPAEQLVAGVEHVLQACLLEALANGASLLPGPGIALILPNESPRLLSDSLGNWQLMEETKVPDQVLARISGQLTLHPDSATFLRADTQQRAPAFSAYELLRFGFLGLDPGEIGESDSLLLDLHFPVRLGGGGEPLRRVVVVANDRLWETRFTRQGWLAPVIESPVVIWAVGERKVWEGNWQADGRIRLEAIGGPEESADELLRRLEESLRKPAR